MSAIVGTTDLGGVERITAGTRVAGLVPMTVHCYRVGHTLVDGSTPKRAHAVRVRLETGGVTDVLLSHHHEDHVGLAGPLAARGARVMAPAAAIERLARPVKLPRYRDVVWGTPEPVEATPLPDKTTTDDATFEIVPTPGHSADHVALLDVERGWLFSGDAFLGRRAELRFDEDLAGELRSLEILRDLDAERLLPGHGGVVEDPARAIDDVLAYYGELHRRAWRLRERGASVQRIARELLGREGFIRYYAGGEFSKLNLARELLRWAP